EDCPVMKKLDNHATTRSVVVATVVLVVAALGVVVFHSTAGAGSLTARPAKPAPQVEQDSYSDVLRAADAGRVKSLALNVGTGKADVMYSDGRSAEAMLPADDGG